MKRFDTKLILIFAAAAVLIAGVLLYVAIQKTLDEPGTCARCHEMSTYVATYLKPENGSIIPEHKTGCFGCHANTSQRSARDAVLREIGTGVLNEMTGFDFNTTSPDLAVNCARCHALKGYSHLNFTARCSDCHWAHIRSSAAFDPYAIPKGPHRNQTCGKCHGKDYKIPECMNCHSGHGGQKLDNSMCLACHIDPHVPKKPGILPGNTVNFSNDMPYSLCVPCHEKEYDELKASVSRHLDMQTCTLCHDSHGKIPGCSQCHPNQVVHGHTTLQCGDCHGNIMNMKCILCHGESHEWNAFTAIRPEDLSPDIRKK